MRNGGLVDKVLKYQLKLTWKIFGGNKTDIPAVWAVSAAMFQYERNTNPGNIPHNDKRIYMVDMELNRIMRVQPAFSKTREMQWYLNLKGLLRNA